MAGLPRQMLSPKMFRSPDSSIPLLHSPWSLTIPFRTFFDFIFMCFIHLSTFIPRFWTFRCHSTQGLCSGSQTAELACLICTGIPVSQTI